jgi:membrane fusion protein, multidrug efflux system
MKKILWISAILITLTTSCGRGGDQKKEIIRPVKLLTVEPVTSVSKSFTGIIEADELSDLTFKVSGTINEFFVSEGQKLTKNQVIASLDPRDMVLQLETARTTYLTAKSKLERNERLLARQAISKQDFESAQAEYTRARASFENAENALGDTRLRAPFEGFVEKKYVENYQKIQAGERIVRLVNPSMLNIKFMLPESNVKLLRENNTLLVEFEAIKGERFKAKIKEFVNASPDGSGIPVTAIIDDSGFVDKKSLISPGFTCTVIINTAAEDESGIAIPLNAVFKDTESGLESVWIYNNETGTINKRGVKLGALVNSNMVLVGSGLKPGDRILAAGVNNVFEGERVNILEN